MKTTFEVTRIRDGNTLEGKFHLPMGVALEDQEVAQIADVVTVDKAAADALTRSLVSVGDTLQVSDYLGKDAFGRRLVGLLMSDGTSLNQALLQSPHTSFYEG